MIRRALQRARLAAATVGDLLCQMVPASQADWLLLWYRIKYWVWQLVTKAVIGTIYLSIITEGFRMLVPKLGQKLHRIPMLGWLDEYEATYRLDMAMCMALFMLIAVWTFWDRLLTLWLNHQIRFDGTLLNQTNQRKLIATLGPVLMAADAFLFFSAVGEVSWGGGGFTFTALFATAAYVAVLVFCIYVGISLRNDIQAQKLEVNNDYTNEIRHASNAAYASEPAASASRGPADSGPTLDDILAHEIPGLDDPVPSASRDTARV